MYFKQNEGKTRILKAVHLKLHIFQYSCYQTKYLTGTSMAFIFLVFSLPTQEMFIFENFVPTYDIQKFHLINKTGIYVLFSTLVSDFHKTCEY